MSILLLLAVCLLAASNGANDNFKGVASLYGSKTASYRTAISWATVCTFLGSMAAIFLAHSLLQRFSGKGLVPQELAGSNLFLLAVALGAGGTVILATLGGFPISTTHSLMGAMLGAGWVAVGQEVNLAALGRTVLLPLILSPILAVALGAALYLGLRWLRIQLGIGKETCLCVGEEECAAPMAQVGSAVSMQASVPMLTAAVADESECAQRYTGRVLGVGSQTVMNAAHFLSAGLVSFARGLNDTPKMAALLLGVTLLSVNSSQVAVAVAIAIGGWFGARRVAETMSHKITGMNPGQGLSANLTTGCLVAAATFFGLPVSTTHVSCGALFGIGLTTGQVDFGIVRKIALSWVVTLPCAAVIGALVSWVLPR